MTIFDNKTKLAEDSKKRGVYFDRKTGSAKRRGNSASEKHKKALATLLAAR